MPDIKFVAAIRDSSHQHNFGCFDIACPSYTLVEGSNSDSDSDSDSDGELDGESDPENYNFDEPEIQQEEKSEALSSGVNDFEGGDSQLANLTMELEAEISDIVEDEKKFCTFVGYSSTHDPERIEYLSYWIGSGYLSWKANH